MTTSRGRRAFHQSGDLVDLAFADIGCRPDVAERDESRFHDCEIDRARKTDGLLEPRLGRARCSLARRISARRCLDPRFDDDRTAGLAARCYRAQRSLA